MTKEYTFVLNYWVKLLYNITLSNSNSLASIIEQEKKSLKINLKHMVIHAQRY